jgi:hypothetical protein
MPANSDHVSADNVFRKVEAKLALRLPEPLTAHGDEMFELEITADQTWQPRPHDPKNRDDRKISIAVCNIQCS